MARAVGWVDGCRGTRTRRFGARGWAIPGEGGDAPLLAEAEDLGRIRRVDVLVERVGVPLREHEDPPNLGVDAVCNWEVDEPVGGPEAERRASLGARQRVVRVRAAGENDGSDLVHRHRIGRGVHPAPALRHDGRRPEVPGHVLVHGRRHAGLVRNNGLGDGRDGNLARRVSLAKGWGGYGRGQHLWNIYQMSSGSIGSQRHRARAGTGVSAHLRRGGIEELPRTGLSRGLAQVGE